MVAYKASHTQASEALYDPFDILGISTVFVR
jgi:hypothetical protein